MRKVKELATTAQIAWSPIPNSIPLIAVGTHGGTLDMTFETKSTLALYSCDLTKSSTQMELISQTEATDRFHRLTWSSWGSNDIYPKGIIAGGSDNGLVTIWDPNAIINGQDALLTSASKHKGTISALEFNPAQQRLILASGGGDGQLLIWDLTNIKKPSIYTPGTRTYETNDSFTSLSWNRQVNHILAGTLSTGRTEIWDLKQKKQVIYFEDKNRQPSCKSIAWDPTTPTQLVTASDDDRSPVILVWDLRQYQFPTKVLKGHKGGIWSLNWSDQDTSLLLSSGKDNIVNCWDIRKGEIISEVEISSNLVHDAQWSPTHASLVCTASLGKVKVHALHDPTCNVKYVDTEDLSSSDIGVTAHPTPIKPDFSKPPKWMRRPVGATFGFGGRLVSFSPPKPNSPFNVSTRTVVTEQEFLNHSRNLRDALKSKQSALEFCKQKIETSTDEQEKEIWTYISAHFEESSNSIFLSKLGYDSESTSHLTQQFLEKHPEKVENAPKEEDHEPPKDTVEEEPVEDENPPQEINTNNETEEKKQNNTDDVSSLFGGDSESSFFAINPSPEKGKKLDAIEDIIQKSPAIFTKEKSEPLFAENNDESDLVISKTIIAGRFKDAIDICIRVGKWADALLLSQELDSLSPNKNSDQSLYSYTKSRYLQHRSTSSSLKIANSIGQNNIKDLISITDIKEWKSLLAIILTNRQYSKENFLENITSLAEKLLQNNNPHAASLCYLISSNITEATKIWNHSSSGSLEQLIEKICLFQFAIESENPNPPLIDLVRSQKINQYSLVIASQGDIELATFYLSKVNNPLHVDSELRSLCQKYNAPVSPSIPVNSNQQPSNTNKPFMFVPNTQNTHTPPNVQHNQQPVTTTQKSTFQSPLTFYDPSSFSPNRSPVNPTTNVQPNPNVHPTPIQFINPNPNPNPPTPTQPIVHNTQPNPISNAPKLNFFDPSVQPRHDTPIVKNDNISVNNPPVEQKPKVVEQKIVSKEALQIIENLEYSVNSMDLGNKKGDLVKKLNTLFDNLRNSNLDEELEGQLLQLSSAIREKNFQVADGINKIIMKNTESWNLLGSAVIALKQLLQQIKQKN